MYMEAVESFRRSLSKVDGNWRKLFLSHTVEAAMYVHTWKLPRFPWKYVP